VVQVTSSPVFSDRREPFVELAAATNDGRPCTKWDPVELENGCARRKLVSLVVGSSGSHDTHLLPPDPTAPVAGPVEANVPCDGAAQPSLASACEMMGLASLDQADNPGMTGLAVSNADAYGVSSP
jgi:hypothetical protein